MSDASIGILTAVGVATLLLVSVLRSRRVRRNLRTGAGPPGSPDPASAKITPGRASSDDGARTIEREGLWQPADEVFHAWTSGDLARMEAALSLKSNPVDRHFLLLQICRQTYQQRRDPTMRATFLRVAWQHLEEFPRLIEPLRRSLDGILPRVPTFQDLATVLTEDRAFNEAIRVCQVAQQFGLDDGTQTGFPGRIARIQKRQARLAKAADPPG